MDTGVLHWLLEKDNPGVRARTLTGLCGLPDDDPQVMAARALAARTLDMARDLGWMEQKGLALVKGVTALAEWGLTRQHVPIDPAADRLLAQPYDANCADMMALRALVMLGYGTDARVQSRLEQAAGTQLPDGGWLCLHRLNKMRRVPKSCYKAAMHALLLAGELRKCGLSLAGSDELIQYFLRRRLFYRTGDPTRLVLDCRPGWRTIDVFFPIELMRVGFPLLLDALAALGVGQAPELQEAWDLLGQKRDAQGRILLEGTLGKSYLPKERVGRPNKWATLYAYLAWTGRDVAPASGLRR